MAVNILFPQVIVNAVETSSAVTIGENNLPHWAAHAKNNFGDGQFFGLFTNPLNINTIIDNDVIDSPITDPDIIPNAQNQQL